MKEKPSFSMYGGSLPTPFFTFPLPIPSREGLSTRDLVI